jgi:hypothetical protein
LEVEAVAEGAGEASGREGILDLKKCIKQLVLNAEKNAKFRLSQKKDGMFSAKIAFRRRKDIKF